MEAILIAAAVAALIWFIYENGKPVKGCPPGPWQLPIVGNALAFSGGETHVTVAKWAQKYGPIMTMKMGPMNFIGITDVKIMKEVFGHPKLTGKPDVETFHLLSQGKYGILSADGDTWSEQRRFALRHLRDLGFGKSHMEELIFEEIGEFINWLKKNEGAPVRLDLRLSMCTVNVIWMLITGTRFDHDDPNLAQLCENHKEISNALEKGSRLLFIVPFLAKLFPAASGYNAIMKVVTDFRAFFAPIINERQKELPEDDSSGRDFLDDYLMEMRKQKDSDSSFNQVYGAKNLYATIGDLFTAGSETTATTISWLILYMLHNPQVQDKLHEELDRIVGPSRRPTLGDRSSLVYTEATIHETLRKSSIVQLGAPHVPSEDLYFHGYKFPKGSFVTQNIWACHHDPKVWDEPEEFRPERFVARDGKSLVNTDKIVAFSQGRRACAGEPLARTELFLFTANLLHRFKFSFEPGVEKPTLKPLEGFLLTPNLFKVVVTDRFA